MCIRAWRWENIHREPVFLLSDAKTSKSFSIEFFECFSVILHWYRIAWLMLSVKKLVLAIELSGNSNQSNLWLMLGCLDLEWLEGWLSKMKNRSAELFDISLAQIVFIQFILFYRSRLRYVSPHSTQREYIYDFLIFSLFQNMPY